MFLPLPFPFPAWPFPWPGEEAPPKSGAEDDPPLFDLVGFCFFGFGDVTGATFVCSDVPSSADGGSFFLGLPFAGLLFSCPPADAFFAPFPPFGFFVVPVDDSSVLSVDCFFLPFLAFAAPATEWV